MSKKLIEYVEDYKKILLSLKAKPKLTIDANVIDTILDYLEKTYKHV